MKKILLRASSNSLYRYLLIGGLAFVGDYGLLVSAYYIFGASLTVSATLGYFVGLAISFSINRYWVFGQKGRSRGPVRQFIEYGILVVINYLFTVWAISVLETYDVEPFIGKILITAVIVIWNYLIFKKLIFSSKATIS